MWRGQVIRPLHKTEINQLKPIDKRTKGNQRALLLLHGFGSSPAIYRAMWPKLTHYDALICPALPGHAESIAAFSKVTYEEWLSSAMTMCEPLIKQYERVEIVGLSLGGLLACHLARQFPVQHLYLMAPAFKLHLNINRMRILGRLLQMLGIKTVKSRAGNLFTHTHNELAYKKLPVHAVLELFKMIEHSQMELPTCPIDLFLGTHDDVVDSKHIEKQFEPLKQCQTHWLDRSAHAIPLDGDIQTIIDIINTHDQKK